MTSSRLIGRLIARPARRPPRPSRRWRRGRSSSAVRRGRRGRPPSTRSTWSASTLVDQPAVEHPAVGAGAVVQPDPGGADLDADRGEHLLGHAAHVGAADDGGEADDRGAGSRRAPRGPAGTPRMVPTETTGLDGGSTTRSASVIASMHARARASTSSSPTTTTVSAGTCGAQPHPVLLEVHDPAAAGRVGVGDRDVGLDPVVGHRQQPHARPEGRRRASAGRAPRSPAESG